MCRFPVVPTKVRVPERRGWVIATLLVLASTNTATSAEVTAEDYARAERFLPWNAKKYVRNGQVPYGWIGTQDRFWYRRETADGKEFRVVDAVTGKRGPAFDHAAIARALAHAASRSVDPENLPFERVGFSEDGREILFEAYAQRWRCAVTSGCRTAAPAREPGWLVSPDEKWAVYRDGPNLRAKSLVTGADKALTTDGAERLAYGAIAGSNQIFLDMYLGNETATPVAVWSPDSKRLLVELVDERGVLDLPYVQHVPRNGEVRPKLLSFPVALPGDAVKPTAALVVFDVETGERVAMRHPPLPVLDATPLVHRMAWWSADGKHVYALKQEEGRRSLILLRMAADTGDVRQLIHESSPTYIETGLRSVGGAGRLGSGVCTLDSGEILWPSERSDWAHLELYDRNGTLVREVTSGAWRVREILCADERRRVVYFTAAGRIAGRNPYQRYLYVAGLDGSAPRLLTPEDADHEITTDSFSASRRFFISSHSRPDLPPRTVLRTTGGKLVAVIEEADIGALRAGGWLAPEPFSALAADGRTTLYGNLFRPSRFDSRRSYPIVENLYPGPQTVQSSPTFLGASFSVRSLSSQSLAELGFILVTLDGRGGPLRSKSFHDIGYGRMHAAGELEDHIAVIRQLAKRYPYIDAERVGVYGNSAGGYGAARAILAYPDFYKVAVASNGDHDKRGIVVSWGPTFQGPYPGAAWNGQANPTLAGNLKGKLLLVTSDMDDNVHPAHSLQLVDALIRRNKDFDLLVVPNARHEIAETSPYFLRRRMDYFVRHLLGVEPPAGYEIKGPGE